MGKKEIFSAVFSKIDLDWHKTTEIEVSLEYTGITDPEEALDYAREEMEETVKTNLDFDFKVEFYDEDGNEVILR